MDDLIKNAVKTKNITNKNKMPDYMLKERIIEFRLVFISALWLDNRNENFILNTGWYK